MRSCSLSRRRRKLSETRTATASRTSTESTIATWLAALIRSSACRVTAIRAKTAVNPTTGRAGVARGAPEGTIAAVAISAAASGTSVCRHPPGSPATAAVPW